jgi:hypothetical protein
MSIVPHFTSPEPVGKHYKDLCWLLGLQDNEEKSATGTCVECLGIEIDTTSMTARLPLSKITKGLSLVKGALEKGHLTRHKTEQITGFLSFCATVIPLGRPFLARLWQFHRSFTQPMAYRSLSGAAISDLKWWKDTLPLAKGIHLLDDLARPINHLWTDASKRALGGFFYQGDTAHDNR